jgi:hypothetical protein
MAGVWAKGEGFRGRIRLAKEGGSGGAGSGGGWVGGGRFMWEKGCGYSARQIN